MEPRARVWGSIALTGVAVSAAVATWLFLIGGTVSWYLPLVDGTLVMIAGSLVGMLLVALAVLPVAARYGVDSVAALRPQMGTKGAYVGLLLMALSVVGWNSVLIVFSGRASAEILVALDVIGDDGRRVVEALVAVVALSAVWLVLRKGAAAVQKVGLVVATLVVLLGALMVFYLVKEIGWSTLRDAQPLAPTDSKLYNYITPFELLVATQLAWWPYIGGLVRMTSGPRKALWPIVLGIGLPVGVLSLIGLAASLAIPESGGDPTQFLIGLGGVMGGVPALAFIVLANFGTVVVGTYVAAVGLGQVTGFQGKLNWNVATALGVIPVGVVSVFFGEWFYTNLGMFLAFLGITLAPICGIQIADNYVLRRRANLRAMFIHGPGTPYHYWKGINPLAFLSEAVGVGVYLYLLNPYTFESRAPYEYISATLPAAFAAGLTYVVAMKLVAPKPWRSIATARSTTPTVAGAMVVRDQTAGVAEFID